MKIVLQAFIGSIIIHLVCIVYTMVVGYVKTKYYKPDIASKWGKADFLQNEVAFSMTISPFFYVFSLAGLVIICGIIIFLYKKLFI